ncbi:flagellar biosynthetic protein FliR [Arthrobacter roseus]|uniref:flagellar biosynthetic protein FliR n=1 Tax=Arthrobacter roseus TaxID=136274 RepID=UPI00196373B6|nr:flagellar biosynthetic protein FliR [Arthrobacter roseus]MBM7847676.1 flagellar biosynthetic protein FliR [Arthrobacter roseus]
MPSQETIEAVMLAGVRMIAFIVVAPPFSYSAIPGRVKAMLAIGLALAVAPRVTEGYVSPSTGEYIVQLILELLTGAALGFLVLLVFSAIQSAGYLIDLFGGFQLAQSFDPGMLVNGAQFTKLFQITALALLFASDGYQLIISGLSRTFEALPIGGGINLADPAEAMITALTQMFLAAVQIGGPLLVVLFLTDVGLGLLTRVAPALNAFALGFPLKIFVTLMLISVVFLALPRIVSTLTGQALRLMTGAS